MKRTNPNHESPVFFRLALSSIATMAVAVSGYAQASAPGAQSEEEELIQLSPFVVTEDESVGYVATSTLAGTRIKTEMRDLAAAISVVTPEFMKDTGTTSIEDVLIYTTSTEIGGVLGNFSAGDLSGARIGQDEIRREPQQGARVRGLGRPDFTRGYFSTNIPGDAYNTGSFTFSRGANSLLFGLGSPAGVVDTGLNNAVIGRNSGEFAFRFGSNSSTRTNFDYNMTLVPGRVAVRIDALFKEENFDQDPTFDRSARLYGAFNAVVLENADSRILGKTIIRGNAEVGDGKRNPPTAFAPSLAWAPFFEPPPFYKPYTGNDYPLGGGYELLTANWQKWAVNDTRRIPSATPATRKYDAGWYESLATATSVGRPDLVAKNHSSSHIFAQLGLVYDGSGDVSIGGGSNLGGFQGWISGSPTFMSPFINTRAYQDGGQNVGFKVPSLRNREVFDYKNKVITGDLQEINTDFDAYSITLEQSFLDGKAGIEGTLDWQRYHIDYYQPFGGNNRNVPIYVDTSLYLPNEQPNPNVGRAFMLNQGDTDQYRDTNRTNERVTAYYDLDTSDFSETLGKWLGRHTITGLWQKEDWTTKGLNYGMYNSGLNFDDRYHIGGVPLTNANGLRNKVGFGQQVVQLAYVSDDLRGVEENDVRLNPVAITRLRDGFTYQAAYHDRDTETWKTGSVIVNRFANGGTAGRTVVTSKALAWQSYLLGENIVGLLGWRDDTVKSYRQVATNARSLANEYLPSNLTLSETPATTQNGNTFTWSVVGHLPQQWVEKVPVVSSLSVHYGVGENFQAGGERHDVQGNLISPPAGETTEYGVSVGFAENKWVLKLNKFETTSNNVGILATETSRSITEVTRPLNNYQDSVNRGVAFTDLANYNALAAAGYTSYDQLFAAIKNLIPQPARATYDYQLNPQTNVWELPAGTQGFAGLTSTTDVVSDGWEVELNGNPMPNWRIALNFVQVEAVNSNSATPTAALQAQYLANLESSKLANIVEGPNSITTMRGRYVQENVTAVIAQRAKDGAVSQELRKYRINLVTTYDFREGRLKGFGVGGAYRYQSAVTTGYETMLDSLNNQVPILDKPFRGPAEFNVDLWLSYRRKITEKINWKIQLNLRNLLGSQDDIPVYTDPDGFDSILRIAPPRQWFITNTFTF